MRRFLAWGGLASGAVLIVFGIVAIVMGFTGSSTVSSSLKKEYIVGTPDMTPAAIKTEAKQAGLTNVDLPTCNVANKAIDTGTRARCFASYMRIHTLEASGGKTYAQMGRYLTPSGKETNDVAVAAKDKNGKPVANGARDLWVTETALTTALNVSYMAQQVGLFSIVVGFALLLSGVGFVILALIAIGGVLPARKKERAQAPTPVVA